MNNLSFQQDRIARHPKRETPVYLRKVTSIGHQEFSQAFLIYYIHVVLLITFTANFT